jgi:arylsulfatase A-like enzyme
MSKKITYISLAFTAAIASVSLCQAQTTKENKQPNIIVVFTDDQGYQDLSSFGSPKIKTPNIDQMGKDGIKLTSFYVASSVCSPSRASLLTGRLSTRHGTSKVYFPNRGGLNPKEITIAEMLKTVGYQTALFGKWHLGDNLKNLPLAQGFDEYYGIPYSNDMFIGEQQVFADNVRFTQGYTLEKAKRNQQIIKSARKKNKLNDTLKQLGIKKFPPVFEGNKIIEYPAEQGTLTQRYFDKTIDYIDRNKNKPFFVFLTPSMPHTPLYASPKFKGTSERGLYGDVVEEIDFHMGRLNTYLKEQGLAENTLVIFTSDNGPWLIQKDNGGSALPLRNGKGTQFEGGVRVPAVALWPGTIKPDQMSDAMLSTLDFLPSFAALTGAKLPNVKLDGVNVMPFLKNSSQPAPHTNHFYTNNGKLAGVRIGDWKYLRKNGASRKLAAKENKQHWLFNLAEDISEQHNLADKYPNKVKELEAIIQAFEASR